MDYLNAFLCGGILCAVGQILIDKTPLTPARILTGYVVAGVLLTAVGIYEPIVEWGGAGATVPLTGFGYSLASGVKKAVAEQGWLGVMTGGLSATAGGIAAAVCFAVVMALIFRPGDKMCIRDRRILVEPLLVEHDIGLDAPAAGARRHAGGCLLYTSPSTPHAGGAILLRNP